MQCIICGLALVVLSIFVSRTTVAITKLYTLKEEYERRFAKMRKFLLQNKIPKELNHRIDVYLKARINLQKWRVEESKVELLQLLPAELYGDLRKAMIYPRVEIYPLIARFFRTRDSVAISRLISTQASSIIYALKDEQIFTRYQKAPGMYILTSGNYDLTTTDFKQFKIGPDLNKLPVDGHLVHWLAEFALITPWVHKDRLMACEPAELVLVSR